MEVGDERVALPDGREIDGFLWIRTRDFAAIVAITPEREVVLLRSYKHGTRVVSLAVPAGYVEDGEQPLAAAQRELREETGYESSDWASLGRFVVDGNYGICTEHVFLARDVRLAGRPTSGDLEEMELVLTPIDDVTGLLREGEIVQLSSAAALSLALSALAARDQ
jgi:8-oxo-dGTP pyrophosphatase MutT (NUDIX family)